jgi:hypothetical protein
MAHLRDEAENVHHFANVFRTEPLFELGGNEPFDVHVVDGPEVTGLEGGQYMVLQQQPVPAAGVGLELYGRRPPRVGPFGQEGQALLGVDPVSGLEVGSGAFQELFGVFGPIKAMGPFAVFVVAVPGIQQTGPRDPSLSFRCRL